MKFTCPVTGQIGPIFCPHVSHYMMDYIMLSIMMEGGNLAEPWTIRALPADLPRIQSGSL